MADTDEATSGGGKRCPLCGEPNDCGMAAGNSACWCFGVTIPGEVLERIPDAAKDKVCICRRCAEGGAGLSQIRRPESGTPGRDG